MINQLKPTHSLLVLLLLSGGVFGLSREVQNTNNFLDEVDQVAQAHSSQGQVLGVNTVVFQHGVNGYSGSIDRAVPSGGYGAASSVVSPPSYDFRGAGDSKGHILLWFDLPSIPSGATINSATLTLRSGTVYSSGEVLVRQMLDPDNLGGSFPQGWSNDGTLGILRSRVGSNGVFRHQTGGSTGVKWVSSQPLDEHIHIEEATAPTESTNTWSIGNTFYDYTVTGAVQSWINGTKPNQGWLIYSGGGDPRGFSVSNITESNRPKLSITYTASDAPTSPSGDVVSPVLSNPTASNITTSGATITWTTDELSNTQVEYGPTNTYGNSSSLNISLLTNHSVNLTGLSPNTTYNYRIKSRDASNNLATSNNFTFSTLSIPDTIALPAMNFEGLGATIGGNNSNNIIWVDNLNDSGAGSLRAAVGSGQSDRIIKFSKSGTLNLINDLLVTGKNITIDGFTAPSPGITITSNNNAFVVRGHDIIIRGFKIRNPGNDGFQIAGGAYNVVIDHNSIFNYGDGAIDVTGAGTRNITASWNILNGNVSHGSGAALLQYGPTRVSYLHNIFYTVNQRNPLTNTDLNGVVFVSPGDEPTADVRYNIMWSYGVGTQFASQIGGKATGNAIGNLYKSTGISPLPIHRGRSPEAYAKGIERADAYIAGNVCIHNCAGFGWDPSNTSKAIISSPTANAQNNQPVPFAGGSVSGPGVNDQQGRINEWTKVKNEAGAFPFVDDVVDAGVRSSIIIPSVSIFSQVWNSDSSLLVPGSSTSTPVTPPPPASTKKPKTLKLASLQGKANITSYPVATVQILSGTTVLKTLTVSADASGNYSIPFETTIPKNISIRIKIPGYLSKVITNIDTETTSNTTTLPQFLAGDFNGDGTINSLDFSQMNQKWNQGDPLFDINGDGKINSLDYSILSGNWNKVGE